ncbi:MAG: antibiotic biosynthesis monooxygenase [Waterburya sp.]
MKDPPVTINVIKQVKPGNESEFENVLRDLIAAAEGFDGHLGATVFRSDSEYRIVFKFNHLTNLQKWEASPIRRKLLERAKRLTVGEGKFQILTGLETWFTLTSQEAIVPPPRYKMLFVTYLAAFPTLNVINIVLHPWLQNFSVLVRTLITTFLMLTLMTYLTSSPRIARRGFQKLLFGLPLSTTRLT